MAGCSIIIIFFVMIPLFLGLCIFFLGVIGGGITVSVISAILLLILSRSGVFDRLANAEERWKPVAGRLIRILLIIALGGGLVVAAGCGVVLYLLGSGGA